ncbi:MAG: response regulator [Oligoflexales bacterium]
MKILVADDHPLNRDLLKTRLERLGHEVVCAENGKEAVDIAKDGYFHLILMDLRMPEMDGYEATQIIKNNESTK